MKTYIWLFNRGAAITCINAEIFVAFQMYKQNFIKPAQCNVTANSSKMKLLGIFELPMTFKAQKFVYQINIIADIKTILSTLISCMPTI
jgi:hypothetical protein